MEVALLTSRIILALVFGIAGVSKFADTSGLRRTLIEFGVPESLANPIGRSLPFIEILIAIALIPLASAWWAAVGALALLVVFLVGIGISLGRGIAPDCNCFGQLHSKPVSWSLFVRNMLLAGLAALVVATGTTGAGLSALTWMGDLKTGEIVSLVLGVISVGILSSALVYLKRVLSQQATLLETVAAMKKVIDEDYAEPPPVERPDAAPPVEGLPVGAPAPGFSLATIEGPSLSLDDLLAYGKPVLLLFVSPNCGPCRILLPIVRVWERDYADHLTIALLSKGTAEENLKRVAKFGGRHLLLQSEEKLVSSDYQATWTPAAVLISPEGKIASQATYGDESIRALVNHTVTTGASTPTTNGSNGRIPKLTIGTSLFRVGEPAPRFSLPDLRGREVHSEDLLGRSTMLLFWSPSCPFCVAMSGDLRGFEENPGKGAPNLAIVVSGDANQDEIEAKTGDFKSLVLVDTEFDVGPLFGTDSTPSAVLIDEHGRIASTLAIGHRNVLALVGIRKAELPVVSHN